MLAHLFLVFITIQIYQKHLIRHTKPSDDTIQYVLFYVWNLGFLYNLIELDNILLNYLDLLALKNVVFGNPRFFVGESHVKIILYVSIVLWIVLCKVNFQISSILIVIIGNIAQVCLLAIKIEDNLLYHMSNLICLTEDFRGKREFFMKKYTFALYWLCFMLNVMRYINYVIGYDYALMDFFGFVFNTSFEILFILYNIFYYNNVHLVFVVEFKSVIDDYQNKKNQKKWEFKSYHALIGYYLLIIVFLLLIYLEVKIRDFLFKNCLIPTNFLYVYIACHFVSFIISFPHPSVKSPGLHDKNAICLFLQTLIIIYCINL